MPIAYLCLHLYKDEVHKLLGFLFRGAFKAYPLSCLTYS